MKVHVPEASEKEFIHKVQSPVLWMQTAPLHLKSDNDEPALNSDYKGAHVPLENVQKWDGFLVNNELQAMVNDPQWKAILTGPFTPAQLRKFTWDDPESGGNINEQAFERLWAPIFQALNLILKMCASHEQNTEDPVCMVIGDGECARKRAKGQPQKDRKRPDLSGYQYVPGNNQYKGDGPNNVYNRIPGDAKLFRKVRHSMLPPDGTDYDPVGGKAEAQKVINQIHDYMDMHSARYGYVVSDEELIFFRRRETGWGHIDIAPPIRHDTNGITDEFNICTTKLVLCYFHLVIGTDDSQWKLDSNHRLQQKRVGPPRVAKKRGGVSVIRPMVKK
jgi:hypothetical protein